MIIPDYLRDPQAIYDESFRQIRASVNLSAYPKNLHAVLLRLIHSGGSVEILENLHYSDGWANPDFLTEFAAVTDIFTDSEMTRSGIITKNLPDSIHLECCLNRSQIPDHAKKINNSRSAAAVDFWQAPPQKSIAVIGNAPTALFRLLENIAEGKINPWLILAFPVGFVGATESKDCLIANAQRIILPLVDLERARGRVGIGGGFIKRFIHARHYGIMNGKNSQMVTNYRHW